MRLGPLGGGFVGGDGGGDGGIDGLIGGWGEWGEGGCGGVVADSGGFVIDGGGGGLEYSRRILFLILSAVWLKRISSPATHSSRRNIVSIISLMGYITI